jgi:excisionase family DNA binding protein
MTNKEKLIALAIHASDEQVESAIRALKGDSKPKLADNNGPKLIGMGKAAEYLGVSRPTLWRMCNRGVFEKVEILPGSHRLRVSDLDKFVDAGW